jgi:transcriptional regulator with XRE-family HTH domain
MEKPPAYGSQRPPSARERDERDAAQVYAMVVGRLVSTLREEARITQKELAARAAVTQPTLSRIERGKSLPDAYTLRRLAEALGMSAEAFTGRAEEALRRTEAAALATLGREGTGPWWQRAVKVAGVIGLGGLVAFAVASALGHRKGD